MECFTYSQSQNNMQKKWQCRIAPSLGSGFAGTPNRVWGTDEYTDDVRPTVFFGLYGMPDFFALWRHKGPKYILWAGSDIEHFRKGYWLDKNGDIPMYAPPLAKWINLNCESWVENTVERDILRIHGIEAQICQSFLGNKEEYKESFTKGNKVYASVSGDDFRLYGWDDIERIAELNRNVEFHLYGNKKKWKTEQKNVIVHGRVSQEVMNKETMKMQGALRPLERDGFSEILAKSILWGQWPVSRIRYLFMLPMEQIQMITKKEKPNIEGREYYLKTLNKYPWSIL